MWNGVDPPRPVMENSILFIFFIFETFPEWVTSWKRETRREKWILPWVHGKHQMRTSKGWKVFDAFLIYWCKIVSWTNVMYSITCRATSVSSSEELKNWAVNWTRLGPDLDQNLSPPWIHPWHPHVLNFILSVILNAKINGTWLEVIQ